jgi:hypothetical protein
MLESDTRRHGARKRYPEAWCSKAIPGGMVLGSNTRRYGSDARGHATKPGGDGCPEAV